MNSDPQNVKDLINNNLAQANSTLTRIRNTNNPKIDIHRRNISSIKNNQNNYRPVLMNLVKKLTKSSPKEANDRIRDENIAIATLNRR